MPRWPGGRERALVVGWVAGSQAQPDLRAGMSSAPRSWGAGGACGSFKGRPWDLDRAPPRTRSHQPAGSPGATPLGAGHRWWIRGSPGPGRVPAPGNSGSPGRRRGRRAGPGCPGRRRARPRRRSGAGCPGAA
uniref:Uncharacterized protein n=1 Tax=Pipistrellus kuhlii TaxID=59472 RepID=A0A7J7VBI9_PIPKU|nr:hypothetical protein mPipKuh1_008483 [Pipistrellus kuhlii]